MPTIPDSRDLGRRVIPQNRTQIVQDRSGEIFARGVQQAAGSLAQTIDGVVQRNDRFNYAAAKSTLLQADIEARRELEEDPDWATHETRYREKMTKAKAAAVGVIKNPTDRAMFEQDAGIDVERGTEAIRGGARKREVDWGRSVLEERLDKNRMMAWEAKDEATRQAFVLASDDLIAGAVEKGYLKQEEAGAVKRGFAEAYAKGAMNMMTPEEGLAALKDTKKGSVGYLVDAPTRALYKERWEKEIEQDKRNAENDARARESQARQRREWAQDDARDKAQKHLAAGGTLATLDKTVWRSMDGARQLELQGWESAQLNKAEKGRQQDDMSVYTSVNDDIEAGNITDPSQLSAAAPFLKDSTLKTLESTIRKRGQVPPTMVKTAFTERLGKTWAKMSEGEKKEYLAFQGYIDQNVQEARRPEDVEVWADRWFMQATGKDDGMIRDFPRYGQYLAEGRQDAVIPTPEGTRPQYEGAIALLRENGYDQTPLAVDDFYTAYGAEASRVLAANGIDETPGTIAAVAYLRTQRQPTTVANIQYVMDQLSPPARKSGPRSR